MSLAYWEIVAIAAGLAIGSFLNVVIFRIDDLKSIVDTRSKCKHCQKEIAWYDLVPILSFVLLRGRCRSCKKKLSWQYPAVEGATALLFLSLMIYFGPSREAVLYAIIYSILIVIFVYDIKTQYVLDFFSWMLVAVCVLSGVYIYWHGLLDILWGILAGGGILGLLVLISKEKWMGLGDVFVGSALGAVLGLEKSLLMIFTSFILGSVYGLAMIKIKNKSIKESLPFTPFIIIASFIALIFGDPIVAWYLGNFYY